MKYLIYLPIEENLTEKIGDYQKKLGTSLLKLPSAGLHCTVRVASLKELYEKEIIETLAKISQEPFTLRCEGLALFDEESLVIKLENNPIIKQLHRTLTHSLRPFVDFEKINPLPEQYKGDQARETLFKTFGSPYILQFYSPHITIGNVKKDFDISIDEKIFYHIPFFVDSFIFSKKGEGSWKKIEEYDL